jgi:hypothetical protein
MDWKFDLQVAVAQPQHTPSNSTATPTIVTTHSMDLDKILQWMDNDANVIAEVCCLLTFPNNGVLTCVQPSNTNFLVLFN